ncbi:MAG: hypothetical protein RI990_1482 [Planctomycetota bacterium]
MNHRSMDRVSPVTTWLGFTAAIAVAAGSVTAAQQAGGGFGYGGPGGQPQSPAQSGGGIGYGGSGGGDGSINGVPPGVGYNTAGGELSRADLEQQALAPEYHFHMAGPTSADAVGAGGGPPLAPGVAAPGYVQAKFVHPYGNAMVAHHYGPGYPPPIGEGGNFANGGGLVANGTVAGNPDLVNWGLTPAWTREEIGNGAWFGSAGSMPSSSPVPYVGSFND